MCFVQNPGKEGQSICGLFFVLSRQYFHQQHKCILISNPSTHHGALHTALREGIQKKSMFLGKSPKLWVGGGQDS